MLTTTQREDNYQNQKPERIRVFSAWEPTPRQGKRTRKKENAQKGDHPNSRYQRRLRKQQEESRKRFASAKRLLRASSPEYRACPTCGVSGEWQFNPCQTASGARAKKPHKGRFDS